MLYYWSLIDGSRSFSTRGTGIWVEGLFAIVLAHRCFASLFPTD